MRAIISERYRGLAAALILSSATAVLLYMTRVVGSGSYRYGFFVWNLLLAWLPLVFGLLLVRTLKRMSWISWQALALTFLWLGFLPNSFYLVTDFIHLKFTGEISLLFDAVMFTSFAVNGLLLGFIGLAIVHMEFLRHLKRTTAHMLVAIVLLACSFAIYLGRYLRWNTWDVLVNPAGLIYDVSDRIINPGSYPSAFTTTSTFFVLLGSLYFIVYQVVWLVNRPVGIYRRPPAKASK